MIGWRWADLWDRSGGEAAHQLTERLDGRAIVRVVIGGALGLGFTCVVGHLFGTAIR